MFKKFWNWLIGNIIQEVPKEYPPECFNCNATSCNYCPNTVYFTLDKQKGE